MRRSVAALNAQTTVLPLYTLDSVAASCAAQGYKPTYVSTAGEMTFKDDIV